MRNKLSLLLVLFLGLTSVLFSQQKPNIIIILADDLGNADVGYNNQQSEIATPNIDALVNNGVKFTAGYVTAPVCGPSRAGLLTGVYQQRFGFDDNPGPFRAAPNVIPGIPTTQKTIAEYFKPLGYATSCIGKWHVGGEESDALLPTNRGFDEFYGFLGGASSYFPGSNDKETLLRGTVPVDNEPDYLTDAIAREANDFIVRNQSNPFMMYIAFNAVHGPLQAPQELIDLYAHIEPEGRRKLCAMQHSMDLNIGKILTKLNELNLDENTLVFFLSDNGGIPSGNFSYNAPYKGEKGTVYEGGIRIPFAIKWPGSAYIGTSYDKAVTALDIIPTALSAAGEDLSNYSDLDGVDLLPYISGQNTAIPHEQIFWRINATKWAVRDADYKLVNNGDTADPMLFKISEDISSENDLYATMPEKAAELKAGFDVWESGVMEPQWGWQPSVGDYVKHADEDFENVVKLMFNNMGGGTCEYAANPNPAGINTSANVLKVTIADQAQDWSGGWASVPRFQKKYRYVHMKVLKERTSSVRFKVEGDNNTGVTSLNMNQYTKVGEWQDLVFDLDFYNAVVKINIQPDFVVGTETVVYIDDIWFSDDPTPRGASFSETIPVGLSATDITGNTANFTWNPVAEAVAYHVYMDGEFYQEVNTNTIALTNLQSNGSYELSVVAVNSRDELSASSEVYSLMMPEYSYIICDFDTKTGDFRELGQLPFEIISNPDKTGINPSNNVLKIQRLSGNTTNWAGVWGPVDEFNCQLRYVHMMVYKERITPVKVKFEGSATMVQESMEAQTITGQWEDLVFDFGGHNASVNKVIIQPDFINDGTQQIMYVDEIIMSNNPEPRQGISTSISQDEEKQADFLVYPLPVESTLYFKNAGMIESDVIIYDINGVPILKANQSQLNEGVGMQSIPAGIYILSCQYNGKQISRKIVKTGKGF
ncbi:sulfatase-like hydrolase/transferase [Carboxylicivirga sediminis]|uniref:Sulfatase-like hydrolase/transferase n=1 Tax=Carboxylicivirga sediminis TaxID=2006564 RepID=A0A941FAW4_9BACT|nr:sulfatase-like hydrolase/transferase [Carboxylicivirga sediminis]MBR8538015.1 sulfatase-like hydrolase/transferase [Carboxylicivirga sediminis]